MGFDQMYPLWLLATKETGGLQWSVPKIGKVKIVFAQATGAAELCSVPRREKAGLDCYCMGKIVVRAKGCA